MPLEKKKVKKILQKKGFSLVSDKDHDYFYVIRNGKKTAVYTRISHGSGKDIHNGLLNTMMHQMRLDKKRFDKYFECTFSGDEYINYLIDNKHIDA